MPQVSGKLIWFLTIGILIAIAIVVGTAWGYPKYLLHKARQDLFSEEPERMGPAFAFLLKRGDAGRKILEDFCRKNTDNSWGKQNRGLRMRISTEGFLVKKEGWQPLDPGILKIDIENVSQKEVLFGICSGGIDMNAGRVNCFRLKQEGKLEKLEHSGLYRGTVAEIRLKPGEKFNHSYVQTDEGFDIRDPGMYQMQLNFSGDCGDVTEIHIGKGVIAIDKKCGAMIETIVSNRITFVVLPE